MSVASLEAGEAKPGAKYDRLIAAAKAIPAAATIVVHPCDESSLRGAADAAVPRGEGWLRAPICAAHGENRP